MAVLRADTQQRERPSWSETAASRQKENVTMAWHDRTAPISQRPPALITHFYKTSPPPPDKTERRFLLSRCRGTLPIYHERQLLFFFIFLDKK
jgi:hypothetical protein